MKIRHAAVLGLAFLCLVSEHASAQYLDNPSEAARKTAVEQRRAEWAKRGVQVTGHAYDQGDVDRMANVALRRQYWAEKGVTVTGHAYDLGDVDRMANIALRRRYWAEKGVTVTGHAYDETDVDRMAASAAGRSTQPDSGDTVPTPAASSQYSGSTYTLPASRSYPPPVAENGDIRGADNDGDGRAEPVHVRGYTRRDGTYVRGHYRASPKR